MLLITTVLFATTVPPVTFVINYNLRGAYLLILLSFGVTIGGVAVGCADIYVLRGAKRRAFLTVRDVPQPLPASICSFPLPRYCSISGTPSHS